MIGVRSVRSKAANKWSVMLSKNVPAFSKSLRTPPQPTFYGAVRYDGQYDDEPAMQVRHQQKGKVL